MTRCRVLIVNADPGVAEELGARLTALGYQVAGTVASGEAALDLAGSAAADVVLLDMAVEGSPNGVPLAHEIRRIHWIPVVFLGTAADEEEMRRAVFSNPWGCLVPPFSDRELRLAIELALCRHGAARAVDDLESYFEISLDLFCVLGVDGYFKRLNPAWKATLGFTREALMSRPFIEFVYPDDRELTLKQNAEVRGGGQAVAFENRYLHKDGSYRWLLWNAAPFSAGGVIYSSARDVTDRKRVEADRERLVRELQASLAEIKSLRDILPICVYCKKIRDDEDYWHSVEGYIAEHTTTRFSHGICPDCLASRFDPNLAGVDGD
ncbi:MAG TPA: PAS domain S-box protein [Woeseiaceae bacterium]|nr:PAS domain S-box protein [Woeseiaceae bacterium]